MSFDPATVAAFVDGVRSGDRYWLRVDGGRPLPDPASRFQPLGPHGPSQVVDPRAFAWTDDRWKGPELGPRAVYELHVGAFTRGAGRATAVDPMGGCPAAHAAAPAAISTRLCRAFP